LNVRYLAVGDIHGCFKALETLAAFVPFGSDDLIITLGDYVDRGPDSRAVLDWVIARQQTGKLVALRGNHELMMLEARENIQAFKVWLRAGGEATLASYSRSVDGANQIEIPESHWRFLKEELRGWFETEKHFFVHAGAYADCPLDQQPEIMLYWESFDDPPPHKSGKIMVCGHTSQKVGLPRSVGHAVCIDTRAYGEDGWLTCLDIASGRYWQANQKGETREDWLEGAR
jgi:serine/threonine protein phosphatase 1